MLSISSTLLSLLAIAHADLTDFCFLNNLNDSRAFCPGPQGIDCKGPGNICAYDNVLGKYYCCSGADYPVCRAMNASCDASDGKASLTTQQDCSKGGVDWCCLSEVEQCSKYDGQINVCRTMNGSPFGNVSAEKLNQTFSSLSAAQPQATSFTFDKLALLSTASTATSSLSTSTGSAAGAETDNDGSLSGGSIAGIVVGAVSAAILVVAFTYFFLRRRCRLQSRQPDTVDAHYASDGKADLPSADGHASELYSPHTTTTNEPLMRERSRTAEMGADRMPRAAMGVEETQRAEMDVDTGFKELPPEPAPPVELPGLKAVNVAKTAHLP